MKNFFAITALISSVYLGSSCASSPAVVSPGASIRFVGVSELKSAYGYSFDVNPYLEPISLIRGKLSEFVVLRIDLSLPVAAKVNVDASLVGPDGNIIESAASLDKMRLFWNMRETSDVESGKRLTSLERSYIPAQEFSTRAGKSFYYVVILGKYPLPRPSKVTATLYVEGLNSIALEEDLSPLSTKK